MFQITIQYFPYDTDIGFLRIKQQYMHLDMWRISFFIHVYTSMLTLIAGFTQFSSKILLNFPMVHRFLGKLYVIVVIFISGPASFVMAIFANGGLSSRIGFVILSLLWIFYTLLAFLKIKKRKVNLHKVYMIRSFALTLSAVSLRIWKVILANYSDIPPMDIYRILAWLGWGINILIAEIIISRYNIKK